MDNQEAMQAAFEKAYLGLKDQGERSVDCSGRCVYRGPEGLKCAIGHIIPDEEYQPIFDEPSCSQAALSAIQQECPSLHGLPLQFLRNLQSWGHDTIDGDRAWPSMEKGLLNVAKGYNLTIPKG